VPTLTDWVASFAQELAQRIGEKRYRLWFAQQTRFHWQDEQLLIGVPNRFLLEWLQTTFARSIQSAAESVAGHPVQVRFVIDPALFQAQRQGERMSNAVNPAAIEQSGSGATDGDLPDAACRDEFRLRYSASASADSSPVRPDVEAITQRETPLAGLAACHQLRATTRLDEFLVGESNRPGLRGGDAHSRSGASGYRLVWCCQATAWRTIDAIWPARRRQITSFAGLGGMPGGNLRNQSRGVSDGGRFHQPVFASSPPGKARGVSQTLSLSASPCCWTICNFSKANGLRRKNCCTPSRR
jgi:hypothetical protein